MSSTIARASLFVAMITIYFLFLMSMFSYFEMASSSIETLVKQPSSSIRKVAPSSPTTISILNTAQKPLFSPVVVSYFPVQLSSVHDDKTRDSYQYPILADDNETSLNSLGIVPAARSVISPEPVVMRNGDMLRNVANWAWNVLTQGRRELWKTPRHARRRSSLYIRVQAKE